MTNPKMKSLTIGGTTYDTVGEASVTQVVSSGTKIATVSIDGTSTDLYAPSGGSTVEPATATPLVDGTAAVGSSAKYAREDHVHPTDTTRQATLVSGTNIKTVNSTSLLGSGNIAIAGLPSVTSSDNGKVLTVTSGAWAAATPSGGGSASSYDVTITTSNPSNSISNYTFDEDELLAAFAKAATGEAVTGQLIYQVETYDDDESIWMCLQKVFSLTYIGTWSYDGSPWSEGSWTLEFINPGQQNPKKIRFSGDNFDFSATTNVSTFNTL